MWNQGWIQGGGGGHEGMTHPMNEESLMTF